MDNTFHTSTTIDEGQSGGFQEFGEDFTPNFTLSPVALPSSIGRELETMAVSERCHLLVASGGRIFRKWTISESEYKAVEESARIDEPKVYLDYTGYHCVVVSSNGNHCYIALKRGAMSRLKTVASLKITAVAYPQNATDRDTGEILLGCSDGSVYSFRIELTSNFEVKESAPKKVFCLPQDNGIRGMAFQVYDNLMKKESSAFVVLITSDSLYQFAGPLPFAKLFSQYKGHEDIDANRIAAPKNNGELKIFYTHEGGKELELRSFAWKSASEIKYGNFKGKAEASKSPIVKKIKSLDYRTCPEDCQSPEAIAITEYNLYLLYEHSLHVVSRITEGVEHTEKFSNNEVMKQICYDSRTDSLWLNSDKAIYQLKIAMKEEDMWQQYLQRKEYTKALRICEKANQKYLGYVNRIYAEAKRREGKSKESALLYTRSDKTFEEVMLGYFEENDTEGMSRNVDLIVDYILSLLASMKGDPGKRNRRVLLCTWYVELCISKLTSVETTMDVVMGESLTAIEQEKLVELVRESQKASERFQNFLVDYGDDLDLETTFELLRAHGRLEDTLKFAHDQGNYDFVVRYYIENRKYDCALNAISNVKDADKKRDLMGKYLCVLLSQFPKETLQELAKISEVVNLTGMTFSLPKIADANYDAAIEYLEEVMKESENRFVYNLYMLLLAWKKDEERLLKFVRLEEHKRKSAEASLIDAEFALHLCKHFKYHRVSVHAYAMLEYYEEAVKLSLELGLFNTAESYAKLTTDKALKRKLWLEIARHSLAETKENKLNLEVLHKSRQLTLADVLPSLPPNVRLSMIPEDAFNPLKGHNVRIEKLRRKAKECGKLFNEMYTKARWVENNAVKIAGSQLCAKCSRPLLGSEQIFAFPCSHGFHNVPR